MTKGEIHMLEGWVRMRKFVSLISILLAFVAMAGEGHATNVWTAPREDVVW